MHKCHRGAQERHDEGAAGPVSPSIRSAGADETRRRGSCVTRRRTHLFNNRITWNRVPTGRPAVASPVVLERRHRSMSNLVEISSHRHGEGRKFPQWSLSENAHAIGRILVCVDQSQFSEACLQHGIAISRSLGAAITLLHVMEPAHERSGLHTTDVLDWEISRQEARAYLERLQKDATHASGRQVDVRLEQGHPAERIAAVARELDADLTILGSQGEHGVTAWNLGSTAQQVL